VTVKTRVLCGDYDLEGLFTKPSLYQLSYLGFALWRIDIIRSFYLMHANCAAHFE
jgi:hypothetical protein